MRKKVMRGITAGAILGTALGMVTIPKLDRGTRKRLKRTSKMVKVVINGVCNNVIKIAK